MVGGSLVVGACLLVLGWTSEIVGIFMSEGESVCDSLWCDGSDISGPMILGSGTETLDGR
jgi:hypothetical protein